MIHKKKKLIIHRQQEAKFNGANRASFRVIQFLSENIYKLQSFEAHSYNCRVQSPESANM
jgi:hypothetical protein